jgi:hypothetical protein
MSQKRPETGCLELAFRTAYRIDDPAEVALEDYAQALTRARAAEAVRAPEDPSAIRAVHVCGVAGPVPDFVRADLEAFAQALVGPVGRGGLGWS